MHLTPREIEKLMRHGAGELAKARRGRGLKLNDVENNMKDVREVLIRTADGRSVLVYL
jgi:urease gamma subunit